MFDYINGKIVSKQNSVTGGASFVVECNNIGYLINTTGRTVAEALQEGTQTKVYTSANSA